LRGGGLDGIMRAGVPKGVDVRAGRAAGRGIEGRGIFTAAWDDGMAVVLRGVPSRVGGWIYCGLG